MSEPHGFDGLRTLDDVRQFVADGYLAALNPPLYSALRRDTFGFTPGQLPLAVANPGPLIEHAVRIAGHTGITLQELREIFRQVGNDRLEEGLKFARGAGVIREAQEKRSNRAGRLQRQVVFYGDGRP